MVKLTARRGFGVWLFLLGIGSCGGGGAGGPGSQFCHDYATALCKKIAACPDPNFQITGDCVAGFAMFCSQPPAPGTTEDVNCSGGKHVNTAARELCLAQYDKLSCTDFNDSNYLDSCPDVCGSADSGTAGSGAAGNAGTAGSGAAGNAGTAGSGAAGNAGTAGSGAAGHTGTAGSGAAGHTGTAGSGAAGSSGTPATRVAFCNGLNVQLCRIEFACTDPTLIDPTRDGTSPQECVALNNASTCSKDLMTVGCTTYDPVTAKLCLDELAILPCSGIGSISRIPSCNAACM